MADELTMTVKGALDWLFNESLDLSTVSDSQKFSWSKTWEDGTGAGEATYIWHDKRTIASGATDNLDLRALSQTWYGNAETITFAKVSLVAIVNTSTTAAEDLYWDATVSADSWNSSAPLDSATELEIPADSFILLTNQYSKWTISAGNQDIDIVSDGTGSIDYKIVIAGTV